jgi:hypothetical protein
VAYFNLVFLAWMIGDGFFPNVDPSIAARHRKSRRLTKKLRFTRFRGAVPWISCSVSLFVCSDSVDFVCFLACYIAHRVRGPFPDDWTGFPAEFAESLKGTEKMISRVFSLAACLSD